MYVCERKRTSFTAHAQQLSSSSFCFLTLIHTIIDVKSDIFYPIFLKTLTDCVRRGSCDAACPVIRQTVLCSALRAVACQFDELNVECYDGDVIRVISANYGRRDTNTCELDHTNPQSNYYSTDDDKCIYNNALQIAENKSAEYYLFYYSVVRVMT